MPVKDLREWIAQTEARGEVKRINGADWQSEIGALTNLYQRQPGLPALLFDEIPGYPKGFRVLSNSVASIVAHRGDAGDAADLHAHGDRGALAQGDDRASRPIPANVVETGPGAGERAHRRRRQRAEVPDAQVARAGRRPLHRHRRHDLDQGPGHRLGQLRHLPGDGARREARGPDDLAGQARPHHPRKVLGQGPAVPGGGGGRTGPAALYVLRHGAALTA